MKNKYKNLTTNTLIFTISNFGSRFISFFLIPLYTAILTTKEYGNVDLMITTSNLLLPLLTVQIQDAVLRFSLDKNYKQEDVIRISGTVIVLSFSFLMIILILLQKLALFNISNNYIIFLFFYFIAFAFNNSLSMYLRSKDKIKLIGVSGIINTVIVCIANIIFLLVLKLGVNGFMMATVLGPLTADLIMIIFGNVFGDLKKGKFNKKVAKLMLTYSFPLIFDAIAWWINTASDRYILTYFCGASANGIYSVAYKIPAVLTMINSTVYSAWSISAITEFDKDDSDGFIGNVFTAYAKVLIIACSGLMFFNIFIAKIIYSNDFFAAKEFVPILLLGTMFHGLGLFIGCIFTAVKKTKYISSTTIGGAIVNTALNFSLIPIIGGKGAALATLLGYFVVFVLRLIKLKHIVKMKVNKISIICNIAVLCIQCFIATNFSNMLIQIPFVIVILVLNKNDIFQIIKLLANKVLGKSIT